MRLRQQLLKVCGSRSQLKHEITQIKAELNKRNQPKKLLNYLKQRAKFKPLAYILQNQPFMNLSIIIRKPVLIPRWETEEWTEWLIDKYKEKQQLKIIELCSGSGCVSLALAKTLNCKINAIEISSQAYNLSRLNQRKLNIPENKLKFHNLDIFSAEMQRFKGYDLVISNPPYITRSEYQNLCKSVRNWEDSGALLGGVQGLDFYKHIIKSKYLFNPDAQLVFEIGSRKQAEMVSELLKDGFRDVEIRPDLAGNARVISCFLEKKS